MFKLLEGVSSVEVFLGMQPHSSVPFRVLVSLQLFWGIISFFFYQGSLKPFASVWFRLFFEFLDDTFLQFLTPPPLTKIVL